MPRSKPLSSLTALTALIAALETACILDLDSLTNGQTSSTGGGGNGTSTCPLFDCSCLEGPAVVADQTTLVDGPTGITVASQTVYWASATSDAISRLSQGDSAPSRVVDTLSPTALAVAQSTLVWAASDGVHACSLPACGDDHLELAAASPNSIRALAFDGAVIAVADQGTGNGDGTVSTCSLGACAPLTLGQSLLAPESITFHGNFAAWVDQGNGNQNGTVNRSPKTTANVAQVAASLDLPTGVAADDSHVYWTSWLPNGRIYRCAHASGPCDTPEVFRDALPRPRDIAIAQGRVLWTNTDDGSILSCPVTGCGDGGPKVHARGRQALSRLAVFGSCVFWTEATKVMRAPL